MRGTLPPLLNHLHDQQILQIDELLSLRGGVATTATLPSSIASLTKNIMGIGVLTIAAGMAAGTGIGPATLAMAMTTLAAAYSFALLGESCEISAFGAGCSFEKLWAAALGPGSVWMTHAAIGTLTFAICAVYLICLGELLPPLLTLFRAPKVLCKRRAAVALAAAATFPLCLPKSLAGLEFSSILGVIAILYTALFSLWRYLDGSYREGGLYYDRMPAHVRPRFASTSTWQVSRETAVLVANLGVALCAHFNAPSFYRSLESASAGRFRILTYSSFGLVFLLSLIIAHPGYLTFGAASQPLILTNYHATDDLLATVARVATAASLACSFPLVFAALRESTLDSIKPLLSHAAAAGGPAWWGATLVLPSLALILAMLVDDLGLVVGLLGSLLGGGLMYVIPPLIHASLLRRAPLSPTPGAATARSVALAVDALLMAYGLFGQMLAGTIITYRHATRKPDEGKQRATRLRGGARCASPLLSLLSVTTSPPAQPLPAAAVAANFAAWAQVAGAKRTAAAQHAICEEEGFVGKFAGASFGELGSTNQGMRAVRTGRVLINGAPCDHASRVQPGDDVTLLPPSDAKGASPRAGRGDDTGSATSRECLFAQGLVRSGQLWVVHEEADLAIVHKPAGIHTKPYGAPLALEAALPGVLTPPPESAGQPLDAPVAVHRLDQRVAGLIVIAKTLPASAALAQAFRDRTVTKRYRAIALGAVDAALTHIDAPIDGRDARTRVRVLEVTPHVQAGSLTTLDLYPETGRRHQLRRHLAELGHPLLGDDLYKEHYVRGEGGSCAPSEETEEALQDDPTEEASAFYGKRSSGLFLQSCEVSFPYSDRHVVAEVAEGRKFARMRERSLHGWEHEAGEVVGAAA